MTTLGVPVRNLVVEWRYEPNLAIYRVMDNVGIIFKEDFSNWHRTPLTLELKDKKHRRRFVMTFNRSFFHVADPTDSDVSPELERGFKMFERLSTEADIGSIRRVGLRQWAAFPRKEPFKELVRKVSVRFQPQDPTLLDALRGTIEDVSYTVEVNHGEGWKYLLRLGPMLRPQWFDTVPHDEASFETPQVFQEYKEAFPEPFLFIDIDSSKEDIPVSETKNVLRSMKESSHQILRSLYDYLKEN